MLTRGDLATAKARLRKKCAATKKLQFFKAWRGAAAA
jgi:hypothetical protein